MRNQLDKLKLKNQVKRLVLLGGFEEKEIAKQVKVSHRTVQRYKAEIFKELTTRIGDSDSLMKEVLLADITSRDEAWRKYASTGQGAWLDRYNKYNRELGEKLTKWGIIRQAPIEMTTVNVTPETFRLAYQELYHEEGE